MWVDLGTTDLEASKNFYGQLFGWEFDDLGPEAGGYNFARIGGKMVCGIGPAQKPELGPFWGVAFNTANTDETVSAAEAAGAKVLAPAMDVMDSGRMAVLGDTAGAVFSVWQQLQHTGMPKSWANTAHSPGPNCRRTMSTPPKPSTHRSSRSPRAITTSVTRQLRGAGRRRQRRRRRDAQPSVPPSWGVYFEVNDTDAIADQAIQLGATELMRDDAPPGRLAMLIDPQGAPFAILKNDPNFQM